MNANRIGIWTIERANADDKKDQAFAGSDFPWYACANLPRIGSVRIPCNSVQQAREFAVCRSIEMDA